MFSNFQGLFIFSANYWRMVRGVGGGRKMGIWAVSRSRAELRGRPIGVQQHYVVLEGRSPHVFFCSCTNLLLFVLPPLNLNDCMSC